MLVAIHEREKSEHDGSVFGREFIRRERVEAHKRLMRNYFGTPPLFSERFFRRRFRMSKDLFIHICNSVKQTFQQRSSCASLLGHSTEQKVTAALYNKI